MIIIYVYRSLIKELTPVIFTINIVSFISSCYTALGTDYERVPLHSFISGTRRTIVMTWNDLISKYFNSNFGYFPGSLSDLLFYAIVGRFVRLHTLYSSFIINDRISGAK